MLKIKDNVDLKELEKYGFRYEQKWALRRYTNGNVYVFENNHLQSEEWCRKNHFTFLKPRFIYLEANRFNGNDDFAPLNNILYELIQADLVEKVQDDCC